MWLTILLRVSSLFNGVFCEMTIQGCHFKVKPGGFNLQYIRAPLKDSLLGFQSQTLSGQISTKAVLLVHVSRKNRIPLLSFNVAKG